MADFTARIGQSALNKLLEGTVFPLVVVEKRDPFPGCKNMIVADQGAYYRYSDSELDSLFAESVTTVRSQSADPESIHEQIYAFAGSIIQQARVVLEASGEAGYEGPDAIELKALIDGGIENIGPALRNMMSDFGAYAWCPLIKVTIKNRPSIGLRSPKIELLGFNVQVRATGELYMKYPWWNCYKYCLKWEKVSKCDRVAHLAVSPDVTIDAHINLRAQGQLVYATAQFDKLRLDYPVLREIPLERLINPEIQKKQIKVYDATKLIATIPIVDESFGIQAITLPPESDGIEIDVDIVHL